METVEAFVKTTPQWASVVGMLLFAPMALFNLFAVGKIVQEERQK